jgi:hypothetical protein
MTTALDQDRAWGSFWSNLETLRGDVRSVQGLQVGSNRIREGARSLVQTYFRELKPSLSESIDTSRLDLDFQQLLRLANSRATKSRYMGVLRRIAREKGDLEVKRELQHTAAPFEPAQTPDRRERAIVQTLESILPQRALSYRQVMLDLNDRSRLSYRGSAHELRDTLRESLDYLAHDRDVIQMPGFKLEDGRTGPTMKQKVKFVMASRGMAKHAVTTATKTAELIDELVGSLTRATYDRGSSSAHGDTDENEVRQIKQYVEVLLCELLEIPV